MRLVTVECSSALSIDSLLRPQERSQLSTDHPLVLGRFPPDLGRFAIPRSESPPRLILSYPPPDLGRPPSPYRPGDPKLFWCASLPRPISGTGRSSLPANPGLRCGGTNFPGFDNNTGLPPGFSFSKLGIGDNTAEAVPVCPNGRSEILSEPDSDRP